MENVIIVFYVCVHLENKRRGYNLKLLKKVKMANLVIKWPTQRNEHFWNCGYNMPKHNMEHISVMINMWL